MKIFYLLTAVLLGAIVLVIISIVEQSLTMVKAQKRLTDSQQQVEQLQQVQHQLRYQASQRDNLDYIKKQIRNKFHLVQPGETMIILPPQLQSKSKAEIFYVESESQEIQTATASNWQAWRQLIF